MFNFSLTVENLSASRGGFALFENISFGLSAANALRLTGQNGSGKTTLLRCLAGLVRPDAGTVSKIEENTVHYLGHLNAMKPQLTVAENLGFWAKLDGRNDIDAALESVNALGLKHLPFSVLSSGQRRRVAFARLLLSPRPLWLLDEPTVGLDTASVALFEKIIEQHLKIGGVVIAATHTPLGNDHWQTLQLKPVQP